MIGISVLILFSMSILLGLMIAVFAKLFEVNENPLIHQIEQILPSYNCGSCGYPGCRQYAEAIAINKDQYRKCKPGGQDLINKIELLLNNKS